MTIVHPPPYIVWSTDEIDMSDPYQRRWYLQQVLMHGRSEDIRTLDLAEIEADLENLDLPPDIFSLWKFYLNYRHDKR